MSKQPAVPTQDVGLPLQTTPPVPHDQRPLEYGGIPVPLDPALARAGAYYNESGELVRAWKIHAGPASEVRNAAGIVVKRIQKYWTRERHVAPPGMTLETARLHGLDFYSPVLGWVRAGIKRERDDPQNMGTGHLDGNIESVEIEVAPSGESLPETTRGS